MEGTRIVGSRHCDELRDGLSARPTQRMVSNFLGRATKLRAGKIFPATRTIHGASVYLYHHSSLCGLLTANVADKVAHMDDEQLFARVDGRTNLLSTAGRHRQPRPAYFGRHRAIRQLIACLAHRLFKTADDISGVWRSAVEFERLVYVHARRCRNCHCRLHVLVLADLFRHRNCFSAQGRTQINRAEFRPTEIRSGLPF